MSVRLWLATVIMAVAGARVAPLPSQQAAPEVAELRRRIGMMRREMPSITAAAEYAADLATRDTALRFLVPRDLDPAFAQEFTYHAGGPPDVADAATAMRHGLVFLPVRSWQGIGLGALMRIQRWNGAGRPVMVVGSEAGKPGVGLGQAFLDNAAPDDGRQWSDLNAVAETMVLWTWYAEFVAAATRRGWQPGIYLSVAAPGGAAHNQTVQFHTVGAPRPAPIPPGTLGGKYLAAVDSILAVAASPAHQAAVQAVADTLIAMRRRGMRLFAAGCGHTTIEDIPRDTAASPFHGVDWRWDVPARLLAAGARRGDAMVWFGYGGYDCPNAQVAESFADAGLRVFVVTNAGATPPWLSSVAGYIQLAWRMPDAAVPVPFAPGGLGPPSSVESSLHYLWLRRLVAP